MKIIERPGIYPRWSLKSKNFYAKYFEWHDMMEAITRPALEYYVEHGVTPPSRYAPPDWRANPPRPGWKYYLTGKLDVYALLCLPELEMKSVMTDQPFDTTLALRAFAAAYTCQMAGSPVVESIPFTALGVVIGCREEAFRLARMLYITYRQRGGWEEHYPIRIFMARILADYLGEAPLALKGEPLTEPITNALFDLWRQSDPDVLVPVCLAACDFHTQCSRPADLLDFSNSFWQRTPVEILLLFKLRQLLGLANPVVNHPIMSTPLGKLPEKEVSFGDIANWPDDDLLIQVRRRMMQDGYDEHEVIARWENMPIGNRGSVV